MHNNYREKLTTFLETEPAFLSNDISFPNLATLATVCYKEIFDDYFMSIHFGGPIMILHEHDLKLRCLQDQTLCMEV